MSGCSGDSGRVVLGVDVVTHWFIIVLGYKVVRKVVRFQQLTCTGGGGVWKNHPSLKIISGTVLTSVDTFSHF